MSDSLFGFIKKQHKELMAVESLRRRLSESRRLKTREVNKIYKDLSDNMSYKEKAGDD